MNLEFEFWWVERRRDGGSRRVVEKGWEWWECERVMWRTEGGGNICVVIKKGSVVLIGGKGCCNDVDLPPVQVSREQSIRWR
jgi:hypothetical protein